MTPDEIRAYPLSTERPSQAKAKADARARMDATGQWSPGQVMGRRWPIGCVALEVTQRCNLDCTLCYLSEHSEAVRDLPLPEIMRRIETIHAMYGPGTNVQITGGDPTLRRRDELVAIVREVAASGMRAALFTNGIKATRDLLSDLAAHGLNDVAFHVDLTQERKGFATEADLNAVRRDYIARARGLGLAVQFNTTIFAGNIDEVPDLVRFFIDEAQHVSLASFQLHADTGRGVERGRDPRITPDGLVAMIEAAAGRPLGFDLMQPGHKQCNRYAATLVSGGWAVPVAADAGFVAHALEATADLTLDRRSLRLSVQAALAWLRRHPAYLRKAIGWALGRAIALGPGLLAGRGRVSKLSFFVHNFMDACALDRERIDACIFHTVTRDGTLSMCLHNARRDEFILAPVRHGSHTWSPVSGDFVTDDDGSASGNPVLTRKTARGRARLALSTGRPRTSDQPTIDASGDQIDAPAQSP